MHSITKKLSSSLIQHSLSLTMPWENNSMFFLLEWTGQLYVFPPLFDLQYMYCLNTLHEYFYSGCLVCLELCRSSALLFWRFYVHQNLYFTANLCKPQEKEQSNHENQTLLSGSNMHYKFIFWLKIFFFPGTSSKARKDELSVCSNKMSNCHRWIIKRSHRFGVN